MLILLSISLPDRPPKLVHCVARWKWMSRRRCGAMSLLFQRWARARNNRQHCSRPAGYPFTCSGTKRKAAAKGKGVDLYCGAGIAKDHLLPHWRRGKRVGRQVMLRGSRAGESNLGIERPDSNTSSPRLSFKVRLERPSGR